MFTSTATQVPYTSSLVTTEVIAEVITKAKKTVELVGAIDQGTSSTRFMLFNKGGEIAAWAQMEHTQIFPAGEDKVSSVSDYRTDRYICIH